MTDVADLHGTDAAAAAERQAPAHWLIVEREENWDMDSADGFRILGFAERFKKTVASFRPGDLLIVYVASGCSSLADCRRVTSSKPTRKVDLHWRSDFYPIRITTEPVITLPRERWIRIHDLVGSLAFTRRKADWRQCFRNAIRRLDAPDAELIMAELRRR